MTKERRHELLIAAALGLVLLLCLVAYQPGLKGPFLFDDFANLPALGEYNGVRDLETLKLYLLRGHAGPTGRPLSLLSFLVDDNAWPSDPRPFKTTNLLLHLINGLLLFAVSRRLLIAAGRDEKAAGWIALFSSALWLLHPLFVSTTLYVVQRMAMLSATFVLAGFWIYLHGRALLGTKPRQAYLTMSAAVMLVTPLAVLSKENGILLPLLLLILEQTLLGRTGTQAPHKTWRIGFLALPSLLIVGYLLFKLPTFLSTGYASRPFGLEERLLTEARILLEYLFRLLAPQSGGRGLYADDYPLSTGLLEPPATLLALLGVVSLIVLGWALRNRYPLLSFSLLFFFGAHLLESTIVPLELYFEHRNYLPAAFLFLPLADGMGRMALRYRSALLLPPALILIMGLLTWQHARIWSDERLLLLNWSLENPNSVRARRNAALVLESNGQIDAAAALLRAGLHNQPQELRLRAHLMLLQCKMGFSMAEELEALKTSFTSQPYDFRGFALLDRLIKEIHQGRCMGTGHEHAHLLLDAVASNPNARDKPGPMRQIEHLRGELALADHDGAAAGRHFRSSQTWKGDIEAGLLQTALLASAGHYREALAHLDLLETIAASRSDVRSLTYARELGRLRRQVQHDLEHSAGTTPR